jgi:DNA replication and repair protein RecF
MASFRNLEEAVLAPGDRFNIIHGRNAQGKTNLLESIYLLGTMKSFRHARNAELISWGGTSAVVNGTVEKDGVLREIALVIERQGKRVRVDRKAVERLADFFGNLNVVVFSPEELAMVKGQPETRRRYLDRAVFSGDQGYLALHHDYGRLLKQRNSLLKRDDRSGLDIWSLQLAQAGARVVERRQGYLAAIEPLVRAFYLEIAGRDEVASIRYRPHGLAEDGAGLAERILAALVRTAEEERRLRTTLVGPHRDDVEFIIDGRTARLHASQGQSRSFVLALKMAEIEYIQRRHAHPPVLLLDDISSELDRERNRNLMAFLRQKEMQVFISTTGLENLALDGIDNYRSIRVHGGKILP